MAEVRRVDLQAAITSLSFINEIAAELVSDVPTTAEQRARFQELRNHAAHANNILQEANKLVQLLNNTPQP